MRPTSTTLPADTSMKTPSGATFLVPKGWHVTEHDGRVVLDEHDRELRVVLLEFERAASKLGVPGAAIAVVQGGRVVFEKGYGVREKGKKAPVTPRTLFMIGSITKSLTSLLMAAAVDAGKMTWDTPVQESRSASTPATPSSRERC
jgi:CubicO group peptidase (beta-lactamase class C family)